MKFLWQWGGRYRATIVLLVSVVAAAIISPRTTGGSSIFLTWGNLADSLRAVAPVGIMGLAMTYVILTGGIDLSVGSLLGLGGVVMASLLVKWDPGMGTQAAQIALAMAGTLLACAAMGCLQQSPPLTYSLLSENMDLGGTTSKKYLG